MSDTWDEPELKLLEERKDWILAEPQLKPVRHALPLWDHIKLEGLNDVSKTKFPSVVFCSPLDKRI